MTASWEIPYLVLIINGFCSGMGTAIGTYLVQRHLFKRMEYLEERLRGLKNGTAGSIKEDRRE